ncbi:hypothetical protein ACA910_008561 [Epithemia clementina (nom. ined.)]
MVASSYLWILLAFSCSHEKLKSRRIILEYSAAFISFSFLSPPKSFASYVRAPIECLYPAARVRLYIYETVHLASDGSLDRLNDLLLNNPPSSFILSAKEAASADQYLRIKTQDAWNRARRLEREERGALLGIDYTTPYDKVNTAIQEMGQKRQFQILRKRQLNLEKNDPIRAALNVYTNNLVFSDSYQLNAQGVERKQIIRNDAMPSVDAVVVSDLDLRDLYRNQILQNIEDARFELTYQLKQSQVDLQEVLAYLKEAQQSCDSWFSFIPGRDVEEALSRVKSMGNDHQ